MGRARRAGREGLVWSALCLKAMAMESRSTGLRDASASVQQEGWELVRSNCMDGSFV